MSTIAQPIFEEQFKTFSLFQHNIEDTRKISVVKKILESFDDKGLKKLESIEKELSQIIKIIETEKLQKTDAKKYLKQINNSIKKLGSIIDFLSDYDIDVPLINKFMSYFMKMRNQIKYISDTMELYLNVIEANQDVKKGKIITIEEAFEV